MKFPLKVTITHTHEITFVDTYEISEDKAKSDLKLLDCIRQGNYSELVDIVMNKKDFMPNSSIKAEDKTTKVANEVVDNEGNVFLDGN